MTSPLFREATHSDLPEIIDLLADDNLGSNREDNQRPILPEYESAFQAINQSKENHLIVAELDSQVIGVVQITILPNLTYMGSSRALIEGVRVHSAYRGQGLGKQIFRWAIEKAKDEGCYMVQLTSDKKRPEAIYFYEQLGFVASHEGMKLVL